MNVEINHREVAVADGVENLGDLLRHEGFSGKGQAVAVDLRVVSKAQWDTTRLREGMKITVIKAVCGG